MSSSTPTEVVKKLLSNTLNPEVRPLSTRAQRQKGLALTAEQVVRELVAPDATYVSLNYDNPDLTKILPYAGSHTKGTRQSYLRGMAALILPQPAHKL